MSEHEHRYLSDPISEKLLESLVALAAEVNVLRDRVARLEAQGGAGDTDGADGDTDAFVTAVFGGLCDLGSQEAGS